MKNNRSKRREKGKVQW